MNNEVDHRRQEVQQIVKNACDELNQEGVDARNYVEQLAWLFFLKAFDEAEKRREEEAEFDDKGFERRLGGQFAWPSWAKNTDHPDAMLAFVNEKLWTKLTSAKPNEGMGDDELAERFRRIFQNVRNYCRRGVTFDLGAELAIVERAFTMEALTDQLAENIAGEEIFSLRDAILRKAFSGEL